MKKVIIIGGGFAGLSALKCLRAWRKKVDVILIDKKRTFDFLPMLPDVIGRNIPPERLMCSLENISKENKAAFICDEVTSLDLKKRIIALTSRTLAYDYLLIASGTETNFYGNNSIREQSYCLDTVEDARRFLAVLNRDDRNNFLIAGGGYTGIEIATHLRKYLMAQGRRRRIIIIEKSDSILGPLPIWIKNYVRENLRRMHIDVMTGVGIDTVEQGKVTLSTNETFEQTMLIWTAGVKTSQFLYGLEVEKNQQGRLGVDEALRLDEHCFAAGDAAKVLYQGNVLRMGVQFSCAQGVIAARNIIRSIKEKRLLRYIPHDKGYIIPMANNKACGRVFNYDVKGFLPVLFHYGMCVYYLPQKEKKMGLASALVKGQKK